MITTSQGPRTIHTLALQMSVEEDRQRAVGARLRELRGPRPQPQIADEVGVTLRAYQSWEAGGGIAWPNLQRLAEVFDVSTNYLLYGSDSPVHPSKDQLDRMEERLNDIWNMLQSTEQPEGRPIADLISPDPFTRTGGAERDVARTERAATRPRSADRPSRRDRDGKRQAS